MKTLRTIGFWVLSYTWGILMTLVGLLAAIGLLVSGHKPFLMGPTVCFEVGYSWSGVSLGPFTLVSMGSSNFTVQHNAGHSLQNIIYGPFYILIVGIPSMVRFWVRSKTGVEDRFSSLAAVTLLALSLISLPLFISGLVLRIPFLGWLSLSWLSYCLVIFTWQSLAIKRYSTTRTDPPYSSIWFEKQANFLGKVIYYNW